MVDRIAKCDGSSFFQLLFTMALGERTHLIAGHRNCQIVERGNFREECVTCATLWVFVGAMIIS